MRFPVQAAECRLKRLRVGAIDVGAGLREAVTGTAASKDAL